MLDSSASSSVRLFRKKLPRGWFTHFLSYSELFPQEDGTFIFWLVNSLSLYIPSVLRSHLKISSHGLDMFYWPGRRIFATWDEVTYLANKKILGVLEYDCLYLDRSLYENRIIIALTKKSREWVDAQKMYIPLNDFHGWPEGDLANALRRYLPHILE